MRRLPGISIVDVPPVAGDGLPVMDVPVFVGFAERGPTDRPVALEDPAQYAAVFGGTVELAPAAGSPAPLRAHLPAAVAAFFAGGGRRCYVIRVAGEQADSARFAVAGLRLATRQRVAGAGAGPWTLAGSDFMLRANSPGSWADLDQLAVRLSGRALHRGDKVRAGDVLRARLPTPRSQAAADAPTGWLRVEADALVHEAMPVRKTPSDKTAALVWLWTDANGWPISAAAAHAVMGLPGEENADCNAPCPDPDNWLIDRMSVDLALRHPARPTLRRDGCALAAGGGDLPWFEPDASARFDAASSGSLADSAAATGAATATGDLVSLGWPLAGPTPDKLAHLSTGPDWMLVPAGVDADFGPWQPAQVADADALARMGLADYRAELFLDPDWINGAGADLRGAQLLRWADDIRFLTANPRRLRGLHAALGRDDAVARDATWIAVPDATHAGWTQTQPPPRIDGLLTPTPDPVCTCDDDAPAFSDCVKHPKRPQPPVFTVAPQAPADVQWLIDALAMADEPGSPPDGASPPAGSPPAGPAVRISYEAQIAHLPDFSDAGLLKAIAGTPDLSPATDANGRAISFAPGARVFAPARYALRLPAGLVFLRARVWRDGLPSGWSATVEVHAVGVTRIANAGPVDGAAVLFPVHAALMDLCAATREHFGLLSVPQAWKPHDLAAHVAQLRARAARDVQAAQASSFVALHHPWLLRREDGGLVAHPPEGAVLGVYARRSRDKGAWSAAGLDPLAEAVALATQIDPGAIEDAGGNVIELRPRGIAATRACTLSDDADWTAIGVRRLFILLRRLARREGERYAFEPNNFTLRRSLERSFDGLLQGLMQRGAFRGSRAPDCYLLRTTSGRQALNEIERGECSLEIRVAPSRPLRFLTLRVVRAGEQLTIEER